MHIRGAFPFLYVPVLSGKKAAEFAAELKVQLEAALSEAFHRPNRGHGFVHTVTPCRAYDFYGFSEHWTSFVKILLINPAHVYKCADLLRTGAVGSAPLQPYESHIPFLLAFLADHDLYGCNWVVFDKFVERKDVTVFNGREFDVDVADLVNKSSGTSLSETRNNDAAWRRANGLAPWDGTKLQPRYQRLAFNWPWERRKSLRSKLAEMNFASEMCSFPDTEEVMKLPSVSSLCGVSALPRNLSQSEQSEPDLQSTPATTQDSDQSWSFSSHPLPTYGSVFCSGVYHEFQFVSPSTSDVERANGISVALPQPFFSNGTDVPKTLFTYGQRTFGLKSHDPADLPEFKTSAAKRLRDASRKAGYKQLEFAVTSPLTSEVLQWHEVRHSGTTGASSSFQIASLGETKGEDEMSILAVELHLKTRFGKAPKPSEDELAAVFWRTTTNYGAITTNESAKSHNVVIVETERAIFNELIALVRALNPDILTGFEINSGSWGYLQSRFSAISAETGAEEAGEKVSEELSFFELIGRVRVSPVLWRDKDTTVLGRYLLNLWNILRHEVTLNKYTLEYVVYHCLHERTPHFSFDELHRWWQSDESTSINTVLEYFTRRTHLVLRLLEYFELINRTCEKARIIGIDFMSCLTRGSQFQVEAVLCRLARKQDYVLISPSKAQVGQQNALEIIPLVMEPQSQYYTDPVCVLDFRSLYPSIVIAFNLCYSTCLGNVTLWRNRNKIGVKQHFDAPKVREEDIYVAPNGMAYVTPRVRRSLLAQMLGDILDTRFMINDTRKRLTSDRRLERNLNSRQLALKFIANVTYGYTSASFSGRMPFAELADSIVQAGREILTYTIRTLESTTKWGISPKVVYGDTDSLFVLLRGVSRAHAFSIGQEMAEMITQGTPDPIHLKLEKVYHPCILMTKKRYVGNSYESPQAPAYFDAKGVETIRRDGVPIVQKIEKRALQIFFEGSDLSSVKKFLQGEWRKILSGECLVRDFCFSQEVKLGQYKTEASLPGGAVVSLRRMQKDDGTEPQYRERVPFLVTTGPLGSRINDRVVSPEEFMQSHYLALDSEYYIQKVIIPPLERLLNLVGANVKLWYTNMPKIVRVTSSSQLGMESDHCASCFENRRLANSIFCRRCSQNRPRARYVLESRRHEYEGRFAAAQAACRLCSLAPRSPAVLGGVLEHPCKSIDCSVYYERETARNALDDYDRIMSYERTTSDESNW